MRKSDELWNPDSCLSRARMDELLFVLLARDEAAPDTIRFWVSCRIVSGKNRSGDAQIVEALKIADEMEKQQASWSSPNTPSKTS
jgi:hypothetical protein